MKLTSADIVHQEFKRTLRGFDTHEVRAFLEVVADTYDELMRENKMLADQVRQLEQDKEKLRQEITSIEQNVREHKAELQKIERLMESRADADTIILKAEADAARILSDIHSKTDALRQEIRLLQDMKSRVAAHVREYLRSQMALLDILGENDATEVPAETPLNETTLAPETSGTPASQADADLLQSGIRKFLSGIQLDDLPPELVDEISIDLTLGTSPEGGKMTDEERRRKILNDLETLSQHATAMFKKSDFHKMLGEDAEKKSEEIINRIYTELEKKKNQSPPEES